MSIQFTTGSPDLDALLEELRAGDNVVFYTDDWQDYVPFVSSLTRYIAASSQELVYVRLNGLLEPTLEHVSNLRVLDLVSYSREYRPLLALGDAITPSTQARYYLFDPFNPDPPWFINSEETRDFFLSLCPVLYQIRSIAYWGIPEGVLDAKAIAAIKDCTQIFIDVSRRDQDLLLTPVKVWARYSESMFRTHRVVTGSGDIRVHPEPIDVEAQQRYLAAMASKNRELTQVRDALNQSNLLLTQRNTELGESNVRLAEQGRLYRSLRRNLDRFQALFLAGQHIGATLVVDQICHAIVRGALGLFDAEVCHVDIIPKNGDAPVSLHQGDFPTSLTPGIIEDLARRVRESTSAQAYSEYENECLVGSAAMAPLTVRGQSLGTVAVFAEDDRLDSDEACTLLGYLASESSIALDNAYLYRELETRGEELRSFVEEVIVNEEQESRRLAFDLHDGLVQIIVAAYQHLQAGQALRGRQPDAEAKEIDHGVTLLRRAINESRRLVSQLRPAGLDDFGLVHALRIYVAQLVGDADWDVSLQVDEDWAELPAALEVGLFRIIQEAATNALKHARSRRLEIGLRLADEGVRVSIRDWGKGFDPQSVSAAPERGMHMGLIGIRERTRLLGGACDVDSEPGEGTTVMVCLPSISLEKGWDQ